MVIASGRDTISVASSIKRLATENVFLVQVKPFFLNLFSSLIIFGCDFLLEFPLGCLIFEAICMFPLKLFNSLDFVDLGDFTVG